MKKNEKKYFLTIILSVFIILGINIIIIIIEDPFSHYKFSSKYAKNIENDRFISPGLIKQINFDTLLIGTSMVRNIKPSYIDKNLGVNSLKISISGGLGYEIKKLMELSYGNNKLKNIIWAMDFFTLNSKVDETKIKIPEYLYDDTIWNDYKYTLNKDVLKEVFKLNKKKYINKDDIFSWDYNKEFSGKKVLEGFVLESFKKNNLSKEKIVKLMKNNYNKNFKDIIHEDIEYIIVFPPYSYLSFKRWEYTRELSAYLSFKKWVINELLQYDNIKIYDFQSVENIVLNLNNYKDYSHYSPQIGEFISEELLNDNYIITKKNKKLMEERLIKMLRKVGINE